MNSYLSLLVLMVLVLIELGIITFIFNNIKFSKTDKQFKNKVLLRDILELVVLLTLTSLLVYNYVKYLNLKHLNPLLITVVLSVAVIIFWLGLNIDNLKETVLGENSIFKFLFKEVDIVKQVVEGKANNKKKDTENNNSNRDVEDYLNKNSVFSKYPANARDIEKVRNYRFNNLYPFYLDKQFSGEHDNSKLSFEDYNLEKNNKTFDKNKYKLVLPTNKSYSE